jgi:hypothetical protein
MINSTNGEKAESEAMTNATAKPSFSADGIRYIHYNIFGRSEIIFFYERILIYYSF